MKIIMKHKPLSSTTQAPFKGNLLRYWYLEVIQNKLLSCKADFRILNQKIYSYFLVLIIFSTSNMYGQVTFTVTNAQMGSANSLDNILPLAISSANLGNNVTIVFDALGLCQVVSPLPDIEILSGSITLQKSITSMAQGIQYAGTPNDATVTYGFKFRASNCSLTLNNITIQDFSGSRTGLLIQPTNLNLTIQGCSFTNNQTAIRYGTKTNATITQNTFKNNGDALVFNGIPVATNSLPLFHSLISNNNFYEMPVSTLVCNSCIKLIIIRDVCLNMSGLPYVGHSFQIESNSFMNHATGIWVTNDCSSSSNSIAGPDLSFQLTILKNTFNNKTYNLHISDPYKHFVIKDNDFTVSEQTSSNILLDTIGMLPGPYGLDLIGTNSLGISPANSHNIFDGPASFNYSSIKTSGSFRSGVRIIGQNLPGYVNILQSTNTDVREDTISNTSINGYPIDLESNGNQEIASPNIYQLNISSGNLIGYYELAMLNNGHKPNFGPFKIDFYKSNTSNSLLRFIGSIPVNTAPAYSTPFNIPIPSTVFLNYGDMISATVTSYGTASSPATPLGTSEPINTLLYNILPPVFSATPPCSTSVFKPSKISPLSGFPPTEDTIYCTSDTVYFSQTGCYCDQNYTYTWSIDGANSQPACSTSYVFQTPGPHKVKLTSIDNSGFSISDSIAITIISCDSLPCKDCIGSFAPEPGKEYLLSAWVKEPNAAATKYSYDQPRIYVDYRETPTGQVLNFKGPFTAKGEIIDGWQRIEENFTLHSQAKYITLRLECTAPTSAGCLFDDVRIFPVDGSMKSYVYDPTTMRLVAELDERNYATFYEYDEEGKLIRVKKETERGIMTIQENRNSSKKQQ